MAELKLFPFQQYTIDRFHEVRSVLIGDEMGLGKTIQAVALDKDRRERYGVEKAQTLIVTPLGVISNWVDHFEKYTDLKVTRINPRNRQPFIEDALAGTYDVYICHWDALRLMPELADVKWFHIVADEVHKIQSRKTKVTVALKSLRAHFRTGLSGTPAFDKPDDLWSILNWLYPSFWTSYWDYFDRYVLWVNYNGYKTIIGVAHEQELQELMRGFYVRRKKEEVVADLPEKYFSQVFVDLDPKQRRAYNQMRDNMLAWVGENEDQPVNASVVIAQLTRLQQFACAYGQIELVDKGGVQQPRLRLSDPSTKIDAAMDLIYSTGGKQIVFFSQFSQVIDLFCARMKKHKITFGKYTGATKDTERTAIVEGFKRGDIQVFAATLGAGGTGLDGLQVASTGVFFDRSWSGSTNQQAIGRLDRIGQKNPVQIIDIVAANTIERNRLEQLEMNWTFIRQLLGEHDE